MVSYDVRTYIQKKPTGVDPTFFSCEIQWRSSNGIFCLYIHPSDR
jgi:hypothetical protein